MLDLKTVFMSFLHRELGIPLAGVAMPEDFSWEELQGIATLIASFAQFTPIPEAMKKIPNPRELLPDARSVIIVAVPNYIERPLSFAQCREKLLGAASALHVTIELQQRTRAITGGVCAFFTSRGFACRDVAGTLFPTKIMASRCGVGHYGKNSMILHPDYGAWFFLLGFITDAVLDADEPLTGDCGECNLCVTACPAKALHYPYRCDETRCVNFHLGHNKKEIPEGIRPACRNLIGQACTVCKDVCPRNRHLKPLPGYYPPRDLLNPSLLNILDIDEEAWSRTFGKTLLGLTMRDKKYLRRNAAIALGNFQDERAVAALSQQLTNGDEDVREYASWALGRIDK